MDQTLRIGFDAKRAFLNTSGLGSYSRTLLSGLAEEYPQHHYVLFTPSSSGLFKQAPAFEVITPPGLMAQWFSSWWRRYSLAAEAVRLRLDLYHGLSHELPVGIERSGISTVVTIHDLIFEYYPEQYSWLDRLSYRHKIQHACAVAHKIVTVSEQTKQDLVQLYRVPAEKIQVVYQTCDRRFGNRPSDDSLRQVRAKYRLPAQYLLHVGAFNRRKNQLKLLQAYQSLSPDLGLQVVLVGGKGSEEKTIQNYLRRQRLEDRVTILRQVPTEDLVAIYHQASMLVYNSLFEGFGIPILEGFHSGIPVITSTGSCFGEVGGEACLYVDPEDAASLAATVTRLYTDPDLQATLIRSGHTRTDLFSPQRLADEVMGIYASLTKLS